MVQELLIDDVPVAVEGQGEQAILMIHGWPHDASLWDAQVEALSPQYRCVRFNFPRNTRSHGGRSLDEVASLFADTVRAVSPDRPVILMLNDWGCVFGYQFALRYPDLVDRIVSVGIGGSSQKTYRASMNWRTWLHLGWVQFQLSLSTGNGRKAREASNRLHTPHVVRWLRASVPATDTKPFKLRWPMLYIYGKRKPFMFHTRSFEAAVQARPDSQVVAFRSCGHWVMREQPEAFNKAVLGWLGNTH